MNNKPPDCVCGQAVLRRLNMAQIIANQALIMLLLNLVGILVYKLKIVTRDGGRQLSALVLEIVTPVLVVHAYMDVEFSKQMAVNLLWTFGLAAVSYILTILGSMILLRKKDGRETAIERFSSIYSNCVFMGIPLASALFGSEGVLYVTAFLTVFFFLSWTHGIMTLTGKRDMKALLKVMRAPTVIGIGIGLVLYFTQLKLPSVIAAGGSQLPVHCRRIHTDAHRGDLKGTVQKIIPKQQIAV